MQQAFHVLSSKLYAAALFRVFIGAIAFLGVSLAADIDAQAETTRLGSFNAWNAFVDTTGGSKTCYVLSEPTQQQMNPAGRQRGKAYLFVTFRPSEQVNGEISVIYGYPMREGSTRAEIAGTRFPLFARDENAWVENVADEPRLVESMRRGSNMRVFGTSTRGTTTIDTYSLSGITAAINRARQECA